MEGKDIQVQWTTWRKKKGKTIILLCFQVLGSLKSGVGGGGNRGGKEVLGAYSAQWYSDPPSHVKADSL